ncbi:hypothetical protein AAC387_Pa11g1494 [Persea americana]
MSPSMTPLSLTSAEAIARFAFQLVKSAPALFKVAFSFDLDMTPSPLASMRSSYCSNSFMLIFLLGFVHFTTLLSFVRTLKVQASIAIKRASYKE